MSVVSGDYVVQRTSDSVFVEARGCRHHVLRWLPEAPESARLPPLLMVHGYMDVAASFQFFVDALTRLEGVLRPMYALDLRGYGRTESPTTDAYWFPDYLGDLDAVATALFQDASFDLLGHSMGGNVSMIYAGVRPTRVRRLVNLEGFGLPATQPEDAPERYAKWLDQLRAPQSMPVFADYDAVAARLRRNNPRLSQDKAAWLARHWAHGEAGQLSILGDPAHKRVNPVLYRVGEALACWARITAPVLFVQGKQTPVDAFWGGRYSLDAFQARIAVVPQLRQVLIDDAGHMLHHDQPEALAEHVLGFLNEA